MKKFWYQVEIEIPISQSEDIAALIIDYGALGVEIINNSQHSQKAILRIAFEQGFRQPLVLSDALTKLVQGFMQSDERLEIDLHLVPNEDWQRNWKQNFKPLHVCEHIWIVAPWDKDFRAAIDHQIIVIDPGMAFGTGQHETTALCLAWLDMLFGQQISIPKGSDFSLLDVGCGSGILGITAVKMGIGNATCIDHDPDAIRSAKKNIELNQIGERIQISTTPLRELTRSYSIVCANILASVLVEMADLLVQRLAMDSSYLLLSGILRSQQDEVRACYEKMLALKYPTANMQSKCTYRGDWVALAWHLNSI